MTSNSQQQQSCMSSTSPLIWFLLLDSATGEPYKGTRASCVYLPPGSCIAQFGDAVKAKHSNKLSSVDAANLLVQKNKAAFDKRNASVEDGKEMPLEEDSLVDGLGKSKKEALIVAVPSSAGSPFRGDEMEVDSGANAFGSSNAFINIRIDGIALGTEHLKRNELVGKLQLLVSKSSIVLLSSPAASGKSSLFKLYQAANRNVEVLGISFLDERTPFASCPKLGQTYSNGKSPDNSTLPGDFPKEAVFQHLFMEGLALHTPPHCSICPELSKIFPPNYNIDSQQVIAGEIDFYLNGSLRWGIELLVNGDGVGEHLIRFSPPDGKYVLLAVNDYAIVDFRRNATDQPTGILKHPNRVSVLFDTDDYSVAQCLFGENTAPIEISLAN
ncbi:hypothetical protein MIR68_000568 [Amoeboaphelidium protococcarum]|nr:hypothetical protein MIR68_000568 [Amoeboaphelidium protococcarum]